MLNILVEQPKAGQIQQILEQVGPGRLLLPTGDAAWVRAAGKPFVQGWLEVLRSIAQREAGQELPPLPESLYGLYSRTGERLPFERVYFERRRMLGRAAICALLDPENPAWLASVERKMEDILHEVSWAFPAHVAHASGIDPLTIDLFCAETANLCGEITSLFQDKLPASLLERVRQRVRTQITDNYLAEPERFTWSRTTNNWNAVCHQGVLGSALALEADLNRVARLVHLAGENLAPFIAEFGQDGGCSEGPGYWEYGFGWFSVLNEQLENRSTGQLSLFHNDPRIPRIAAFGRRFTLENGQLVNFSDCVQGVLRPQLFQYLGERLDDEANLRQAQVNYKLLSQRGPRLDAERLDLFFLGRLFLYCPDRLDESAEPHREDFYERDLEVLVVHGQDQAGRRWAVAAKGGHNAEHHNHNDCGSFVVQVNGTMMVEEIGSPEYTREFFSSHRYENLAARSLGHSTPLINGYEQSAGRWHGAEVLKSEVNNVGATFTMDLDDSYPEAAGIRQAVRTINFERTVGVVTIEDTITLREPGEAETAVMTRAEIEETGSGVRLTRDGVTLWLVPDADTTRLDRIEELTYRDHAGHDAAIRRIVLKPLDRSAEMVLRYQISGDASPTDEPKQA